MAFEMFVDSRGVPYSDYGVYRGVVDIGRQRSILAVAERGLWYWNEFVSVNNDRSVLLSYDWELWPKNKNYTPEDQYSAKVMMTNCADWLLDAIETENGFSVWKYPYPFSYNTKPGWRSSHAQTVGMQLLVRMKNITNDDQYVQSMDMLLQAFNHPVEHGGLCVMLENGCRWYEKIADPENEQPKVLNGMLFAIIGLLDIAAMSDSSRIAALAADLANDGIESVLYLMEEFDLGDWTAYSIDRKRASVHYHSIHIEQLNLLYSMTGDDRIRKWRDQFESYRGSHENK